MLDLRNLLVTVMTCGRGAKLILVILELLLVFASAVSAQNSNRPAGRIAYVHNNGVWIKDLPAGEAVQVLAATATDLEWSASSSWLAVHASDKTVVISANSQRQFPILSDTISWSPVKDELAFKAMDGVHVDRFNRDGPQARIIMRQPNVGGFVWSHDGSRLAVTVMVNRSAHLWIANDDGSPAHEIPVYQSDSSQVDLGEATLAGWSGDDKWILLWPNAAHSASLAADGFGLIAVPYNGGHARFVSEILKDDVLLYKDYVAFARHKPGIVFTAGGNRESWTNKRVAFVDPATGRFSALTGTNTAAASLDWSPDGTRMVFSLGPDAGTVGGGEQAKNALAQRRIWLMNVDGRQARQLTTDPQYRDEYPLWSHDGRTILFTRMDRQDNVSVWTMDAAGRNLQKVVDAIADPVHEDLWFSYYGHIWWSGILAWTR